MRGRSTLADLAAHVTVNSGRSSGVAVTLRPSSAGPGRPGAETGPSSAWLYRRRAPKVTVKPSTQSAMPGDSRSDKFAESTHSPPA